MNKAQRDEVMLWAIEAAAYPPTQIKTYGTTLPAWFVEKLRRQLDDMGIDWKSLKTGKSAGWKASPPR